MVLAMKDAELEPDSSAAEGRAIRALDAAIACFGMGGRAAAWLTTPNPILDWDVPIEVARRSEAGCVLVCDVLRAMEGISGRRDRM